MLRPYAPVGAEPAGVGKPGGECGTVVPALALCGPRDLSWTTMAVPSPAAGWALVRTLAVGVCGTDLGLISGAHTRGGYPLVLGHEWSGEVHGVGSLEHEALLGRRVVGENVLAGRRSVVEVGFELPGGFAAEFLIPAGQLYPVLDELDPADLALAEPTAVAWHVLNRLAPKPRDRALVYGDGPIGLLIARLLSTAARADVMVVGRDPQRLEMARAQAGAAGQVWPFPAEEAREWDVVVEASGDPAAAALAIGACRDGGVIALVGSYRHGGDDILHRMTGRNVRIEGVNASHGAWPQALASLADGTIPPRMLQPGIVPIEDGAAAIADLLSGAARPAKLILSYLQR